jgi:hypothetical protein
MKSEIIERLGQTDILLPSLIAEGLAANDRVKARLSVVQTAGRHARDPSGVRFDLKDECHAAGIDLMPMEALVNHASLLAGERITAPGLGKLGSAIWDDVATMVRAVKAGDTAKGNAFLGRLSTIKAAVGWNRRIRSNSALSQGLPEFPTVVAKACIASSWICTKP